MTSRTFPKGRIGFRKHNPHATKQTNKMLHLMFPYMVKPINILGAYHSIFMSRTPDGRACLYLVEKQEPTDEILPDFSGLVGKFQSYTNLTPEEIEKFGREEQKHLAWMSDTDINIMKGNRFGKLTLERIDD